MFWVLGTDKGPALGGAQRGGNEMTGGGRGEDDYERGRRAGNDSPGVCLGGMVGGPLQGPRCQ